MRKLYLVSAIAIMIVGVGWSIFIVAKNPISASGDIVYDSEGRACYPPESGVTNYHHWGMEGYHNTSVYDSNGNRLGYAVRNDLHCASTGNVDRGAELTGTENGSSGNYHSVTLKDGKYYNDQGRFLGYANSSSSGGKGAGTYRSHGGNYVAAPVIVYQNCKDIYNDGRLTAIIKNTPKNLDLEKSYYQLFNSSGNVVSLTNTSNINTALRSSILSTEEGKENVWRLDTGRIPSGQYQLYIYFYPPVINSNGTEPPFQVQVEVKDCERTITTIDLQDSLTEAPLVACVIAADKFMLETVQKTGRKDYIDEQKKTIAAISKTLEGQKVAHLGPCTEEEKKSGGEEMKPDKIVEGQSAGSGVGGGGTKEGDSQKGLEGDETVPGPGMSVGGATRPLEELCGPSEVSSNQSWKPVSFSSAMRFASLSMSRLLAANSNICSLALKTAVDSYRNADAGVKKLVDESAKSEEFKTKLAKANQQLSEFNRDGSEYRELISLGYNDEDIKGAGSLVNKLEKAVSDIDKNKLDEIARSLGALANPAYNLQFLNEMQDALARGQYLQALLVELGDGLSFADLYNRLGGANLEDYPALIAQAAKTIGGLAEILGIKSDTFDSIIGDTIKTAGTAGFAIAASNSILGDVGSFVNNLFSGIFSWI